MPRYDYFCGGCALEFEAWKRPDDRDRADCPVCREPAPKTFDPRGVRIQTPEHFRHLQSDFLPEKGDPIWEDLVHVSEVKPKQPVDHSAGFREALEKGLSE